MTSDFQLHLFLEDVSLPAADGAGVGGVVMNVVNLSGWGLGGVSSIFPNYTFQRLVLKLC